MNRQRFSIKNILIFLSGILFVLFVCHEVKTEKNLCMGVPVVAPGQIQQMAVQEVDLDNIVLLEDTLTAFDIAGRKIYLPCSVDETTRYHELSGQLKSTCRSECRLSAGR